MLPNFQVEDTKKYKINFGHLLNTVKWMALLSGDATILRWEIQTVRAFLIRVAGKLIVSSRQQRLKVPEDCLFPRQWEVWVEVGLT